MKRIQLICLSVLLVFALMLCACGNQIQDEQIKISIDENGVASWNAVPDAIGYEYGMVDNAFAAIFFTTTEDTQVQLYEGYCLHIRAIFADGSNGDWYISEFYGDPENPVIPEGDLLNPEGDFSNPEGDYPYAVDDSSIELNITVDENGLASWDAVPNAVEYYFEFWCDTDQCEYTAITKDTQVQLYDGYSLRVAPIFADGSWGVLAETEVYGDPEKRENLYMGSVSPNYSTQLEDTSRYELISNIRYDTVKTEADGSVYFEATGPNGDTLRFIGKNLTVTEGKLIFSSDSELDCLDAIGRICAYVGKFANVEEGQTLGVDINASYTFSSEKLHVDSVEELAIIAATGMNPESDRTTIYADVMMYQPNFISLCGYFYATDVTEMTSLTVFYDETTYCTPLRGLCFNIDFYTAYLEGEIYDPSRETFDPDQRILDFYLIAIPDLADVIDEKSIEEISENYFGALVGIEDKVLEIGDLKDAEGNVLDKLTHGLQSGDTIEVAIGDYSFDVEIPIMPVYTEAQNMNDLVPYAFPEATGTLNTLVIPIIWQDEPEDASDEMLALYRSELGRVMDENGNITDYSDETSDYFSLSEYYDISSYGQLSIQSFITDWYYAPANFSDVQGLYPDLDFTNAILEWLYETYPDMDWTQFDKDANGYFDAAILLNSGDIGDSYVQGSFGGGVMYSHTYTAEYAGTSERPTFNCYTSMNTHMLGDGVLVHEYAHNLGLIDYYDVTYSGIDAVGSYDMQSANIGDWNAYSKYAVGWIEPEVITGLESGESVEITIGAFATTGDVIVIPGASSKYYGTPFSEYIMIDLFTDAGVNEYDAESYGLDGAVGVRIYHVNSPMEYRELTVEGDDEIYPIGTVHVANDYDYSEKGNYLIELIQAGGVNTFTDLDNLRTLLSKEDLFKKGDVFTAEDYSEFFHNGKMADGTDFGYTVKIVSITKGSEPTATIRITRD